MIREEVQNIIDKYKTNKPAEIIKHLGVEMLELELPIKLKGVYIHDGEHKVIAVNNLVKGAEKQIVLAHELGHLFLHDDEYNEMRSENLFPENTIQEWEANKFASELLLHNLETDLHILHHLTAENTIKFVDYKLVEDNEEFYKLSKYYLSEGEFYK